jgi:hypothetical protein
MDRAETEEHIDSVNEEAGQCGKHHQPQPNFPEKTMPWRPFLPEQNIGAEECRGHNSQHMNLNSDWSIE